MSLSLKTKFIISILLYTALSIASQYGSSKTIDLTWLFAGAFIPLSAFTFIPLLDCSRSFSQGCAERAVIPFKISFGLLVVVPLIIAGLCMMFASLPPSIFIGALFATGIGGFVDVMTFKFVGKWFKEDHQRMSISNLSATLVGGYIFFLLAFSPFLTDIFGMVNILNKGNYLDPALSSLIQSAVIYTCGMIIAWGTAGVRKLQIK